MEARQDELMGAHEAPRGVVARGAVELGIVNKLPVGPPARVRRQGSPTDVLLAGAPGHPSRTPFRVGYPNPGPILIDQPAAVVKGRPAPGLFGLPVPAELVGVDPRAVGVGAPVLVDPGAPNRAPNWVLEPLPIGFEFRIEDVDVDWLILPRGGR